MLLAQVSPPHDGLGATDFTVVFLYLAGTLAIAVVSARKSHSTEEFFLGGRRMPWFAVGLSILASLLSTISYTATPGETIKYGIANFMSLLAMPFSIAVVFGMWVPFFMRLRLTSAYEYLELRFNYPARLLGAILFVLLRLGWMGVVVYTSAKALSAMTNYSIEEIIILVGIFATIYTAVGGIRAVIWTDVVQGLTLVLGAVITICYIGFVTGTTPADWWTSAGEHTRPPIASLDITESRTALNFIIGGFFWVICTHASDQVVLQRYFSTDSLKSARNSFIVNIVTDIVMMTLLALCGLALLSFYTEYPSHLGGGDIHPSHDADKVFPYFISHQLPAGIGGLILAALIAAAMSSIDSGVNSVSAVVTTDLRGPGRTKSAASITVARLLTLIVGALATTIAYGVAQIAQSGGNNIVELMPKAFNMFLGPLAGLFFIGMFVPRCSGWPAVIATAMGIITSVIWSYWKELFDTPWAPTFNFAVAAPCLLTVFIGFLLSLFLRNVKPSQYAWRAVVRGTNGRTENGKTNDE